MFVWVGEVYEIASFDDGTLLKYDTEDKDIHGLNLKVVCTDGTTSNMTWCSPIQKDYYLFHY